MSERVSADDFAARRDLPDWRYILGAIHATYSLPSFDIAADFITAIAAAAEAANHHPEVDLHYPGVVHVQLTTHDHGGLTSRDTDLAGTIATLAAARGSTSDPIRAAITEIAIDTLDARAILPFWQAVLGYVPAAPDSVHESPTLVDPRDLGPSVWFQQMDVARPDRNTMHIDVEVAHDVAEQRLDDALAAGGRLVTDEHAPSFWVLADAEGNEVCICTWQSRS